MLGRREGQRLWGCKRKGDVEAGDGQEPSAGCTEAGRGLSLSTPWGLSHTIGPVHGHEGSDGQKVLRTVQPPPRCTSAPTVIHMGSACAGNLAHSEVPS